MVLTDHQNRPYKPTHFLTIYTRDEHKTDVYMEMGPILQDGGKYKIGPSVQADKDFLNAIVASVKTENFKALKFKGVIPRNIVYYHSESENPTIIWAKEEGRANLYFSTKGIASGIYQMPHLLFACCKGELYVFRLASDDVIDMDTPLFMLPLPNIYDDGSICQGNGKTRLKKPKTMEEYIQNMETIFYNTKFNAYHHKQFGEGVVVVDLMREKNLHKFPYVPTNKKTFKAFFDELSQRV